MKTAPSDFDVSTSPLRGDPFIPPKSHNSREIARRRAMVPGELRLEFQRNGIYVGRTALAAVTEPESVRFILHLLAHSGLNSAWHTFAEDERNIPESIRRRRLKLPRLKEYRDADELLQVGVKDALGRGEELAGRLLELHRVEADPTSPNRSKKYDRAVRDFATCVGNASLAGACVLGLGDSPIPGTVYRAQIFAREQAFQLGESRERVAEEIGSIPSYAQLAYPYSDESVYWRHNAPDQAHDAFVTTQNEVLTY